jgi:hypothetical protein
MQGFLFLFAFVDAFGNISTVSLHGELIKKQASVEIFCIDAVIF